ncbi:MAG TPA: DoxX family protein [Balneolaceae bacterium]|nr:DoxX family protein [Balneolaceae bacterium]
MKPKKLRVSYWALTILFSLFMLSSGIQELLQTEGSNQVMNLLEYPLYLSYILGTAKVFGVIAILQNRFSILKEWAYAGFTIDFIGAAASGALTAAGPAMIIGPMGVLAVMFLSYYLWKRVMKLPVEEANYAVKQ